MNSSSPNSGASGSPVSPPPPISFFLVLPDGSCTPATPKNLKIVMKQARSDARKQAKAKRMEKAAEIQMALEDRAAARRLYQELAELERAHLRWAAQLNVRVRPDKPNSRTSPVKKRLTLAPMAGAKSSQSGPPAASSWVIDDYGMRGVIWQQSYLGRKSPDFYRGAARDNWEYHVRDEAVLLDADGEPVIISNMGEDWIEIGAAWQAMEDASTRKNAKIQILAIAPFDADMSREEMIAALRHFCESVLVPLQLPYSAVIHRAPDGGDERNVHPHIAFSLRPMRRVDAYSWEVADEVCGELDGKDGVQMLRHLWAHSMSEAAERAQRNMTYTGLGYGARGLDLETGEHLDEPRSAMVRRGERVPAHERNRIKNARNAQRRRIRDCDSKIAALTKVRDAALAHVAAEHNERPWRRLSTTSESPQRARLCAAAGKSEPAPRLKPAHRARRNHVPLQSAAKATGPSAITPPRLVSAHAAAVQAGPTTPSSPPQDGDDRLPSGPRTGAAPPLTSSKPVAPPIRLSPSTAALRGSERLIASGMQRRRLALRHASETQDMLLELVPSAPQRKREAKPLAPSHQKPENALPIPIEQILLALQTERSRRGKGGKPAQPLPDRSSDPDWIPPFDEQGMPAEALRDVLLALARAPAEIDVDRDGRIVASRSHPAVAELLDVWRGDAGVQPLAVEVFARAGRVGWERWPEQIADAMEQHARARTGDRNAGAQERAPAHVSIERKAARLRRARWNSPVDGGRDARRALSTIATIPSRRWLEANPMTSYSYEAARAIIEDRARLAKLNKIDAYIGDFGSGALDLHPMALKTIGADEQWLARANIQEELATMRAEQQRVVTAMVNEADRRPLAFAKAGRRFWPRDLEPRHLERLDR